MFKRKNLLLTLTTLLLVAVISVFLVACDSGSDNPNDTTTGADQTTAGNPEGTTGGENEEPLSPNLEFIKDGVANFTVIRSEDLTITEAESVALFCAEIERLTGVMPTVKTDMLLRGEVRSEEDDKAPAIIIGNTNYTASAQVASKITTYNNFAVEVVGNQLIIATCDSYGLSTATGLLKFELKKFCSANEFIVPRDYTYENTDANNVLSLVPICKEANFNNIKDAGDDGFTVTLTSATAAKFEDYVARCQTEGLSLYTRNQIGENLYATLTKGKLILNVMFSKNEKKLYLFCDNSKNTSIHPISDQKTGDYVPLLTQVGLEYNYDNPSDPYFFTASNYQIGNAYIFRLADGSFIVMDGGYNQNYNAKMLYDIMKSQQNDKSEKITIAAWIFSHIHGDHIGCFKKFMDKYRSEINLEYVIYNSGSEAQCKDVGESSTGMESAAQVAINYVKSGHIIIAKPGQKMVFRNITIDMYHTSDLMGDDVKNGNSLCIAYRCVIAGQSFFFTGDCMTDASDKLVALYGSALQSDFEQVNHHGATGPTNALHAAIDPTIVLWPLGEYDYFYDPQNPGKITRSREEWNTYLFTSPKIKEIILAGHTTRTLTLPYVFPLNRVDPVQTIVFHK